MKFADWKIDLERRLNEHLEGAENSVVAVTTYDRLLTKFGKHIVDVLPSATNAGDWVVFLDKKLVGVFTGDAAQAEASKFASDFLNRM